MKISELITLLEVVRFHSGDDDVHVEYHGEDCKVLFEITDLQLYKSSPNKYITFTCDQNKYIKLTKK
jgi:hypothetical protein